jgi:PAS domain S-box-containing protein
VRRKDLEDIVNLSPLVVFLWRNEPGWPVEMVSENVSIFGYSADDFISQRIHYADIIHPSDLSRIENEVCQHTVQYDCKFVQNYRITTKDGQIRWVEDRTTIRLSPSGEITHYQGIIVDVTSRMLAEEALRQEKELAQMYLDIVETIVISIRSDHTVSLVNQAGCRLLGYREDEIIGTNWFSRFLPARAAADVEDIFDLLMAGNTEQVRYVEGMVLTRNGEERIVSWHNTILRNEAGDIMGTLSSGDDITERKRADEALIKKSEELARSNADLAQFAYAASHDLQELRTITSFVQLLQKRYHGKLDPDADEFIDFIVGGTKRMQQLINDLLTYSRVNTRRGPLSPMNIEDVVQKAIQNLRYFLEEVNGTIIYDEMPTIVADELQMIQLFQNLIGNALKFHGEEPPRVEISAALKGNDWIFSVKDNGIGIDPQYKDRIFEIFQRLHTREEYSGTGIGLAIAKKIVQRHGGRIWVDSEPGKGTTFRFTIPAMIDRDPSEVDPN